MLENASLKAAIATGTASELESALKNASANKSVDASVVREAVLELSKLDMSRGAAASAPAVAEGPSSNPVGASMEAHVLVNSDTMTWYTGKNASGTTYYWSEAGVSQYDRPADFDELVARYEMEKLERVVAAPPPGAGPARMRLNF